MSISRKIFIQFLFCLIAGRLAFAAETCPAVGQICSADCVTLLTCIATEVEPATTHLCVSPTPYCVNGRCSIAPYGECQTTQVDFQCTSKGVFPNPQDCTRYHMCTGTEKNPLSATCPSGFVYSPRDRLCQVRSGGNCRTMLNKCGESRNARRLVRWEGDAQAYYAYCSTNTAPVVFRCADEQNEIYDEQQSTCRYNCQRSGLVVNRFDCKGFILCHQQNGRWTPQEFKCPDGYEFKGKTCERSGTTACISELT